ncbi:MAG TPA: hypothetical protein VNC84_07550 [Gammaproteobacteria bacterium]|jgi:hypothetical protein|nr:hypothetical protein [Gammaproteobacteria bacterium]
MIKIKAIDLTTGKPLANFTLQTQIQGKSGGFRSFKTDASGLLALDDELKGQQLASTTSGTPGEWITIQDGAVLKVRQTLGSSSGAGAKNKDRATTK